MRNLFILVLLASTTAHAQVSGPSVNVTEKTCVAINAAIQQLPTEGGKILLDEGVYSCSEPMTLNRDNVTVVGKGVGRTVLRVPDGAHSPVVVIGDLNVAPQQTEKHGIQFYPVREVSNDTVQDLTADGNRDESIVPKPDMSHDFECFDPAKKIALNCNNDGGRYIRVNAFTIRHANGAKLLNVEALRAESGGLVVEKLSSNLIVDHLHSTRNFYDGFAGYETQGSIFRNLILEKNQMSGISIDFNFDNNTFDNVILRDNGDNGLFTHSVTGLKYLNMQVVGNKNHGFWIDGIRKWPSVEIVPDTCNDVVISNVQIDDNGKSGITLHHPCKNVTIDNVSINRRLKTENCLSSDFGAEVTYSGAYSCQ